jgi:rubrerythrin
MVAASLSAEAEVTSKHVYNLLGGILAWEGRKLSDLPRVQVFDKSGDLPELLHTAMDLEKGAWRFYRTAMETAAGSAIASTLAKLAEAETAHARSVYRHWAPTRQAPEPFEALFEQLAGKIMEGGETVEDALGRMDRFDGEPCMNMIELALHIEYSAYDLYRTVAERSEDARARSAFLSIAQAEKGHMRMLARAVARCEETA